MKCFRRIITFYIVWIFSCLIMLMRVTGLSSTIHSWIFYYPLSSYHRRSWCFFEIILISALMGWQSFKRNYVSPGGKNSIFWTKRKGRWSEKITFNGRRKVKGIKLNILWRVENDFSREENHFKGHERKVVLLL